MAGRSQNTWRSLQPCPSTHWGRESLSPTAAPLPNLRPADQHHQHGSWPMGGPAHGLLKHDGHPYSLSPSHNTHTISSSHPHTHTRPPHLLSLQHTVPLTRTFSHSLSPIYTLLFAPLSPTHALPLCSLFPSQTLTLSGLFHLLTYSVSLCLPVPLSQIHTLFNLPLTHPPAFSLAFSLLLILFLSFSLPFSISRFLSHFLSLSPSLTIPI